MKIAIIGGGAAGLMAAASAQETNPASEVYLIERNNGLGKKVIISGGGRCNVTTGIRDIKILLTKYPRGGKFLTSAMHHFSPAAVYDWFEAHGVPLKTQADERVFPKSDQGQDVVRVFEKLFASSNVQILLNTTVEGLKKTTAGFEVMLRGRPALLVDSVIITTGGQAYRQTGSTGDGYAFAQSLGHTITALAPSLNSFTTLEKWPAKLTGLSFDQATLTAHLKKKINFSGPFLFTHKGVSGPAVFALSALVAFEAYNSNQPLNITIDLFPKQKIDELTEQFKLLIGKNPRKNLVNFLDALLPKSLADDLPAILAIDQNKHAGDLNKKEILGIAGWLKAVPLTVIGRGAGDEFVTAGGVTLSEVNPATMESKICPGLFFAGEILDVDGFTGGFNLQASWAAGHLAGAHAAARENKNFV